MTIWWLAFILAALGAAGIAFIWLVVRVSKGAKQPTGKPQSVEGSIQEAVDHDVQHVFNNEFREELRNRGRLNFEKIITENAMFLQQDLRLTTSQLNEYMKSEISAKLKAEFDKYEQSIGDAKELAIESIQKTNLAIDKQRGELTQQMEAEIEADKKQHLARFEANMAEIVNHYVLAAVGN